MKPYTDQAVNCLDFKLVMIPFKLCGRSVLLSEFCKFNFFKFFKLFVRNKENQFCTEVNY